MSKAKSNTKLYHTVFGSEETEDGWEAWEKHAENEIMGEGPTRAAAIADYCQRFDARDDDEQE